MANRSSIIERMEYVKESVESAASTDESSSVYDYIGADFDIKNFDTKN